MFPEQSGPTGMIPEDDITNVDVERLLLKAKFYRKLLVELCFVCIKCETSRSGFT